VYGFLVIMPVTSDRAFTDMTENSEMLVSTRGQALVRLGRRELTTGGKKTQWHNYWRVGGWVNVEAATGGKDQGAAN
jgi:hypothetical protein